MESAHRPRKRASKTRSPSRASCRCSSGPCSSRAAASPYRETEGMRDRSDAIADWPLLNALLNAAAGADLVAVHNGGGVGIGYSTHAGALVVCDGTEDADRRIGRVLTTDPGMGVV